MARFGVLDRASALTALVRPASDQICTTPARAIENETIRVNRMVMLMDIAGKSLSG